MDATVLLGYSCGGTQHRGQMVWSRHRLLATREVKSFPLAIGPQAICEHHRTAFLIGGCPFTGLPVAGSLLTLQFFFSSSSLESSRFTRQLEFRPCWEILDIVLQIVGTRQCLAVERDLATSGSYEAHSDREGHEDASEGMLIDCFAVHLGCLRVQASSGRFAFHGMGCCSHSPSQPVSA